MIEYNRLIVDICTAHGIHIAVAESLTGGMVTAGIVDVSGASAVLVEGIVAYANEAKEARLLVPRAVLDEYGAVSSQTACCMAQGLIGDNVQVAVATTGIAGPGGGTDIKPVGLTYIGVAAIGTTPVAYRMLYDGDRTHIREQATQDALRLLYEQISKYIGGQHNG